MPEQNVALERSLQLQEPAVALPEAGEAPASAVSPAAQERRQAQGGRGDERERAIAFGQSLCALLQRQRYYVPLTQSYLLPQVHERTRAIDGQGIATQTLRAYLRGEALPSDGKARLLADALGVPRGVMLFASGYLTPEDLPNYPGPYTTLDDLEADMREVETLPLAPETKERILRDLRRSVGILRLLYAERAQGAAARGGDERENLIEQLIQIWETAAPPPPPVTSSEEAARERHGAR